MSSPNLDPVKATSLMLKIQRVTDEGPSSLFDIVAALTAVAESLKQAARSGAIKADTLEILDCSLAAAERFGLEVGALVWRRHASNVMANAELRRIGSQMPGPNDPPTAHDPKDDP